jgi:serine/threonine-protein kinase
MTTPGRGTIIAGRYRLMDQLGQGGMGSVWKAEHMTLRSEIAVKLIDPEISGKAEMLERFQREAQAAAALRSPHVVQILDYGVDAGVPYIAMELLDGETLADRLRSVGRLSPLETVRVVTHVARALSKAHEAGIVHRDLKPENVFLVPNDDHEVAKVLDFGVAKHSKLGSGKGPTRTGLILGTPGYMSPEQAQGTKTVDFRSDLWALGVIAYECVVGQVPFESEALGDLLIKICVHPIPVPSEHGQVPLGFDAWFARACSRDTEQRFQSAKELADALRSVLTPDLVERASGGQALTTGVSPPNPRPGLLIDDSPAGGRTVLASASSLPPSATTPAAPGATMVASPGGVSAPRTPGVTVPGMSVALQSAPTRSAAPLVALVAVSMLALGAGGAFYLFGRRREPIPEVATALTPPSPVDSGATKTLSVEVAPTQAATASAAAPGPTTTASVSLPSAPSAAPSAKARQQVAQPHPTPKSPAAGPTEHPKETPPPPPPHGVGDQRLGF